MFRGAEQGGREGVREGVVPHYRPGQNPFVEETTTLWGIPLEAVQGGPETIYPEYRKKLRDKYVRPEKCVANASELTATVMKWETAPGQFSSGTE